MKIIVFGATGTIGKQLVKQALEQGNLVTAFSRDPGKLQDFDHVGLQKTKGDVLDAESVAKAIKGHEAVLCALGAGRKGTLRSSGTLHIIRGMEKENVKRLICQTTLGAGDSRSNLNFFWKRVMFGWFLKDAYEDHQLQEKHVCNSGLAWTIVRPAAFTDKIPEKPYQHGFAATYRALQLKISRQAVAEFMLQQLTTDAYLRKTPGLSY
jgi:uncharacterized protein YbjT (DUF2867 family)